MPIKHNNQALQLTVSELKRIMDGRGRTYPHILTPANMYNSIIQEHEQQNKEIFIHGLPSHETNILNLTISE